MKKQFLLSFILLCSVIISGCGGDDDNPAEPEKQVKTITSISGVLENWNLGSNKTISLAYGGINSLVSFGSSEVKEDGSFAIALSVPDSALLKSVSGFINGSCEKNIAISDMNGRYLPGMLIIFEGNSPVGFAQHGGAYGQTQNDTAGSFIVNYYYFDRDIDISGIESCGSKERYEYALNFQKGWNREVGVLVENTSSSVKYVYKIDMPEGSKFIFNRL